jgi:hypothetical protein
MRRAAVLMLLSLVLGACAQEARTPDSGRRTLNPPTSCHDVIPACNVPRLPDKTLTGDESDGALQSTDGFDFSGIISFDDALKRGWREGLPSDPESVQVVLGSAEADKLHWGTGSNLYYAIEWKGLCLVGNGPAGPSGAPPPSPQCGRSWASVFDAHTGAFIVEGT